MLYLITGNYQTQWKVFMRLHEHVQVPAIKVGEVDSDMFVQRTKIFHFVWFFCY